MSNRDTFILNLMRKKGMSLDEAEAFVEDLDIPEGEPERPGRPRQAWEAGDTALVRRGGGAGDKATADRYSVAARGANGLTATQQAGIDRGQALCPNCHEPEDDHIPGCLRDPRGGFTDNERRRTVTKGQLPPAG